MATKKRFVGKIPFLGTLPIDPRVGEILDRGTGLEELFKSSSDGGKSSLQAVLDFVDAKVASDEKAKE